MQGIREDVREEILKSNPDKIISCYKALDSVDDFIRELRERPDRLTEDQIDSDEDAFLLDMPFLFAVIEGEILNFSKENFEVLLDKLPEFMLLEMHEGNSLLDFAVKYRRKDIVNLLLKTESLSKQNFIAKALVLAIKLDHEIIVKILMSKLPMYSFGPHLTIFYIALSLGNKGIKHIKDRFEEDGASLNKEYYDCPAKALKVPGVVDALLKPEHRKIAEVVFNQHLLDSRYFNANYISLQQLSLIRVINPQVAVQISGLYSYFFIFKHKISSWGQLTVCESNSRRADDLALARPNKLSVSLPPSRKNVKTVFYEIPSDKGNS